MKLRLEYTEMRIDRLHYLFFLHYSNFIEESCNQYWGTLDLEHVNRTRLEQSDATWQLLVAGQLTLNIEARGDPDSAFPNHYISCIEINLLDR